MPLTPRYEPMAAIARSGRDLDHELESLQNAVAVARRNSWHGGDIIEPEFENFLSALTKPEMSYASRLEGAPAWRQRHNSWREVLHEVG